jgi:LPS export ABC transporter protein LptC
MSKIRRPLEVLVAFSVALVLTFGCSDDSSEQIAKQNNEVPDEVVTDFVTEETDSGRVSWKLTAPKAYKYTARKVFIMDKPKIEFFDDFGNLQTTLVSENGEYFESTRDMLAYGDVVVVSMEGDVLETDSLRYVNTLDQIVTDSRVKLTRGNSVTTGTGLRCDHNLNSVEILRDVKATIVHDEG